MTASSTLVKAQDLAPKAFGGASINDEMSSKVDDLVYDVHHLLACDTHPVSSYPSYSERVSHARPVSDLNVMPIHRSTWRPLKRRQMILSRNSPPSVSGGS